MHHPPGVQFLVRDSPWLLPMLVAVSTLAALQLIVFALLSGISGWQGLAVGSIFLMSLGYAWTWMIRWTPGILHWDGKDWHWSGFAEVSCQLQWHLDFQSFMLVSVRSPGHSALWMFLHRRQSPQHWMALRRAVVHARTSNRPERTALP